MRIESDGHSRANPRMFELIEHAPKTGTTPWAWPELIDHLKIAGQPVSGPWPPHQEPRPDPEEELAAGGHCRPGIALTAGVSPGQEGAPHVPVALPL